MSGSEDSVLYVYIYKDSYIQKEHKYTTCKCYSESA